MHNENLEEWLFSFLVDSAVSEEHSRVVARYCAAVFSREPRVCELCRDSANEFGFDPGRIILAVLLEDSVAELTELNTPHPGELREAVYMIYDRTS